VRPCGVPPVPVIAAGEAPLMSNELETLARSLSAAFSADAVGGPRLPVPRYVSFLKTLARFWEETSAPGRRTRFRR